MRKFSSFFILFFILCFSFSSGVYADSLNQNAVFSINSDYEYSGRSQVSATLKKISDKAYWYVSDEYWNRISPFEKSIFLQELDELASEFDDRIYPLETQFWGSEPKPGIDNDSRVTVLITQLVDYAGGYFDFKF